MPSLLLTKPVESQASSDTSNKNLKTINLADAANGLEKLNAAIQEQTDDELYVFDLNGNKVLL